MGDDITNLLSSITSMTVFSRNKTGLFTGSTTSDFRLDDIAEDAGAIEWTAQKIIRPTYIDDGGIRDLTATQAFGDFKLGTISRNVTPLLETKRKADATPIATVRSRRFASYRVFYSDNSGIDVFLGKKSPEITAFDLELPVRCIFQGEDSNGNEVILFGSDDGYVYQLDAGNSFDGTEFDYFARLAFATARTPQLNKNWKSITLDVDTPDSITISFGADFNFASSLSSPSKDFTLHGGGGFWDEAFWSEFEWDSPVKGSATARINNDGRNISAVFSGTAQYDEPHTLQAVTYLYSPKGLAR
jgi:hypothetical protein